MGDGSQDDAYLVHYTNSVSLLPSAGFSRLDDCINCLSFTSLLQFPELLESDATDGNGSTKIVHFNLFLV